DPGYLTEPDDSRLLLDGIELIRETMGNPVIAGQVSLELNPAPASPTGPHWPPNCRTAPPRCTTPCAPAGWARTNGRWWIRSCGSAASTGSGSPTPRSCPASPAGTPTPPP